MLIVDAASGLVTSASRSWESYGLSRDELVDETLLTFVHPDDRVAFEPYLLHPVLARTGPVVETRFARTNGWVSALARIRPSPDDRSLVLTVFPVDDVMARTVEAERRAAEQLATVDELRNRLVEATSHEMRTPLTIISGFAETLQRTGLTFAPDDLHRVGNSIQRHALRLERIIGDLIDLGGSDDELSLDDVAPCNVAELVRRVLGLHELDDRQVHASIRPAIARVDRSRFRRAVEQLLDNVQRHTPPGTHVWVELTATDSDILLAVSDDGPGLSDDVAADAFGAFTQGPANTAAPGLGLGLAGVQRCAELHGGQCWYVPREGGGSRFVLRLPRDPTTQRATAAALSSASKHATAEQSTGRSPDSGADGEAAVADSIQSVLARARQELDMRVAYLSELTPTEQVVIGTAGDGSRFGIVPGLRLPLEETFCARMVEGRIPNAIPDTADEPTVAALASTRAGLAAYVGVPVHLPSGHVFGTLCCADDRPRPGLDGQELSALRALAGVLGDELGRQQVSVDEQRQLTDRIEEVLRRRDGLTALYQPIARLHDGKVAGVEALSRFPDNQLRPPDTWFADAARVGLAGQLEQTAALRALAGLSDLPDDCYMSINFSPDAIQSGGLRPLLGRVALDRIVIEITEHASIADYDRTATLLRPFRDGGARLAIDDVGAGFSSLRHVLRMSPEIIKLDRSLVADVTTDPAQRAIASAFGELAHRLDASVVAEGIEDSQTRVALIDAGVTHGQGWFFDKPGRLPLRTSSYGPPEAPTGAGGVVEPAADGTR